MCIFLSWQQAKRRLFLVGGLALILLLLAGCGGGGGSGPKVSKPPPINYSDYYPLTKGTSRSYDVTLAGTASGTKTQVWTNGLTYNGQATVRTCESATEWEDEAYVNGQTLSYGLADETGTLVSSSPPIVNGIDNWEAGRTITTSGNLNFGGISTPFKFAITYAARETVTVPAGTFADSVRLDFSVNDGLLTGSAWYALGVGGIKSSDSDGEVWVLTRSDVLSAAAPTITALTPNAGAVDGGNLLALTGSNFQSSAQLTIANKLASSVLINGANNISGFIPAGELGGADVAIVNPDCQVAITEGLFEYKKVWTATSTANVPAARTRHTAVWTGSEMLVWGGHDGNAIAKNTGGRFDPASNTWSPMSTTGAPQARYDHTAVWTGTEMIVWGGLSGSTDFVTLGTGARYNPQTDTWTSLSSINAPSARFGHSAVWTGSEMIIWGGDACTACGAQGLSTGAAYDPITDTWTPLQTSSAPSPRAWHSAVWTGSEMLVWGGSSDTTYLNTGARYDPTTDSWTVITNSNAPSPRRQHATVWSGAEMIVYGGDTDSSSATFNNSAARYNPSTNTWQVAALPPPVTPTFPYARAVWTGSRMYEFSTNLLYDPVADSWAGAWTSGRPAAGQGFGILWNGSKVMVWGGVFASSLATGGLYDPAVDPSQFPEPLPSITSINPTTGSVAGGTSITISGAYFRPKAQVSIGGIPALGVTVVDDTTVMATTPAGNPGYANVVVSMAGIPWWQTTATAGFAYTPFSFEGWIGGGSNGWQTGSAPDSGRPGDAEFSGSTGLAIDTSGNIFAADSGNNRIQKWNSAGNYLGWIGGGSDGWQTGMAPLSGVGNGQFDTPTKVHLDAAGNIYIADYANNRIQKWDSSGNRLGWIGGGTNGWQTGTAPVRGSGDGQFDGIYGIALDDSGNIYAADYWNHRVQKWDTAGNYVGWIGGGADGWQTGTAPATGTGNGSFKWPMGIAVDSAGNIYVADSENWRVQKWDSSGNRLGWIGGGMNGWQTGTAPASDSTAFGAFTKVYGINLDVAGNIYVANAWSHSVYKWDAAGNAIGWIGNGQYGWQTGEVTGTYGTALGYFNNPEDVAMGQDGKLYIADSYNGRIQKWKE